MSSKALRTHHKLQPFINNLFLPGFKCRGRIKQEKEQNTKDEGSKETESMKRREESKTELNNQRKEEKKVKIETYNMSSTEEKEMRKEKGSKG